MLRRRASLLEFARGCGKLKLQGRASKLCIPKGAP